MSTYETAAPSPSPLPHLLPHRLSPPPSNPLSVVAFFVIFILCPCCCCYWCGKNKEQQFEQEQQSYEQQLRIRELQRHYRGDDTDHIVISTAHAHTVIELAPRQRITLPSDSRFIEIGTSLPSECVICLEDIRGDKEKGTGERKICMMPVCKHMFHVDCIQNWVKSEEDDSVHTCPVCRASI